MKYGLPYKGSKNKLAERIVRFLPKRDNLVDLFCGGCAVSHAALLMGKYKHIHINDLNWMCPTLFLDALSGKYNDDTRWISREDFFRLRDTDPYVAVVWSFGNNLRDYLYSQEIEPLKRAIHYAIFFSDYEPGRELGHDLSFVDDIGDVQRRYIAVKRYFSQFGHFQQQSFEGGGRCKSSTLLGQCGSTLCGGGAGSATATRRSHQPTQHQPSVIRGGGQAHQPDWRQPKGSSISLGISPVGTNHGGGYSAGTNALRNCKHQECRQQPVFKKKNYKRPWEAEHRERTNGIAQIAVPRTAACHANPSGGGQSLPITSSVLDYAEVEIPKGSVIYCDIPYEGTNVYNGAEHFDYERFYRWAESQTEPVFISSYDMPRDRFDCVIEWDHRSTLNDHNNNAVKERIFVPKNQTERGNVPPRTLSLFDDL